MEVIMIPKVIHYIWVGGKPLSELAEKCVLSWKTFCPDYEIKRWDESNFDINSNSFCKEAYESKKWAFVSDYIRLKILYEEGGIYIDTDIELIKPLDEFLEKSAVIGFESDAVISSGFIACEKNSPYIKMLLDYYDNKHFIKPNGKPDLVANVVFITDLTKKKYKIKLNNTLQDAGDFVIYPKDYFCAKDLFDGKIYKTDNTHAIHYFTSSWYSPWQKFKHNIKKFLNKISFGLVGKLQRAIKSKKDK